MKHFSATYLYKQQAKKQQATSKKATSKKMTKTKTTSKKATSNKQQATSNKMTKTKTKIKTNINIKPFCKICYDFNKPEQEYTSHWVKDKQGPEGKVVCPYLLNMECRYCHEKGHLLSNCPILKQKNKIKKSATFILNENTQKSMMPPGLELLQEKLNVDNLPKIPSTLPPLLTLTLKPKEFTEDKQTKITYADKCKYNGKIQINKTEIITTKKKALLKSKKKFNWADSDNETEDENEDDKNNIWLLD